MIEDIYGDLMDKKEYIKKVIAKTFEIPEEEAEKFAELVDKYHVRQIIIGIRTAMRDLADKRGKIRRKITVEEFEKYVRKVRF